MRGNNLLSLGCTPGPNVCEHTHHSYVHPSGWDFVFRVVKKIYILWAERSIVQTVTIFFPLHELKPDIGGFSPSLLPCILWRFSNPNRQVLVQQAEMPDNKLHFTSLCMYEWNMNYSRFIVGMAGVTQCGLPFVVLFLVNFICPHEPQRVRSY